MSRSETHLPKRLNSPIAKMGARRMEFHAVPFLDDTPMDPNTPPRLSEKDFSVPRLRKCPWDVETID